MYGAHLRFGERRLLTDLSAILLPLFLAMSLVAGPSDALASSRLFGSSETRSTNMSLFPKWRGALIRYFEESKMAEDCSGGLFSRCHLQDWEAFLEEIRGEDPRRQLDLVNTEMNRQRYIIDPRNWGVEDYWATPLQFFRKNGDCEDYAIAKYMSLRALGWPDEALRIVVVKDTNLRAMHAILVVYLDGEALVLDNQSRSVIAAARIRHYHPVYSVNESSWWLHRA